MLVPPPYGRVPVTFGGLLLTLFTFFSLFLWYSRRKKALSSVVTFVVCVNKKKTLLMPRNGTFKRYTHTHKVSIKSIGKTDLFKIFLQNLKILQSTLLTHRHTFVNGFSRLEGWLQNISKSTCASFLNKVPRRCPLRELISLLETGKSLLWPGRDCKVVGGTVVIPFFVRLLKQVWPDSSSWCSFQFPAMAGLARLPFSSISLDR